ncbi:MAG: beta-ketoacyl-ACP synthase II [Acidobacteria bacterium]|nr:beta-ketoacyl-ACP synthase II [Acidobacteriota bacterium]
MSATPGSHARGPGPRRRVVVTGVAAVSPLGLDAESSWRAVVEGRSGIGPITVFDPTGLPTRIAGEVRGFDVEQWMEPREARKFDRFVHLAIAASRMLLESGKLDLAVVDRDRVGVVIGSGIGGMPLFERQHRGFVEQLLADPARPERAFRKISPYFIPGVIINMASGMVSIVLGLRGPNSATVTACATGNHAIIEAASLIREGHADVVLAGGTEAVLGPMAVGGFCSMKALSTRNEEPERASRPFDKDRDGFVMAEGCGLLLLEGAEHAAARGASVIAELAGYGLSGDAFHISAPPEDGSGMVRVMHAALADAALRPGDIDYVNAHGTSTPTGDVIEARAVRQVFGEHADRLLVSSTKSMTGHLLGAAGGLEAVFSVFAVQRDEVPPTINLDNLDEQIEDPARGIGLARERFVPSLARRTPVRAALSNSFGFGGTNATLVFRKYQA